MKNRLLLKVSFGAMTLILVIALVVWRYFFSQVSLMSSLPLPPKDTPYMVVHSKKKVFPLTLSRLLMANPLLHSGAPSALLPLVEKIASADESVLLVSANGPGLSVSGAMRASKKAIKALNNGMVPSEWNLGKVQVEPSSVPGIIGLSGTYGSFFVFVDKKVVYFADSLTGALAIKNQHAESPKLPLKWTVEPSWNVHLLLSDGGLLQTMGNMTPENVSPISFQVALTDKNEKIELSSDHFIEVLGESRWQVSGLDGVLKPEILSSLKPVTWSDVPLTLPAPSLFSVGMNIPRLPNDRVKWPSLLRIVSDQLMNIGMSGKDLHAVLEGPAVFNIGGEANILWLTVPGVAIELTRRGDIGIRLVDLFWKELFMGATPTPIDGFTHGGMTDLPFPILAAARADTALIGTLNLGGVQDAPLDYFVESYGDGIGWMHADVTKLSESMSEMAQISKLFSEEEDATTSDESLEDEKNMRDAFHGLARFFINWEEPNKGSAFWFK